MARNLRQRSWIPQADGTIQPVEVPGPESLMTWEACFAIWEVIVLMLRYPPDKEGDQPIPATRPLCLFRHNGHRAARWIAVWRLLAEQEEEEYSPERIGEQTVDAQVPQIAAKDMLQERISEHTQNTMCQCRRSPCPFPFRRKLLR